MKVSGWGIASATARSNRCGAVTQVSCVIRAPQPWPISSTGRPRDQRSISAITSPVRAAKSSGPAVGEGAYRRVHDGQNDRIGAKCLGNVDGSDMGAKLERHVGKRRCATFVGDGNVKASGGKATGQDRAYCARANDGDRHSFAYLGNLGG